MTPAQVLGANVRRFRQVRGLTVRRLAALANGDPEQSGWISTIEHGRRNATLTTVAKLAEALEVPMHELLVDRGGAPVERSKTNATALEGIERRLQERIDVLEHRMRKLEGER